MEPLVSLLLLEQRAELARRSAEISRELKRAREEVRRSHKVCSAACWRNAVAILCLCDGDTSAACAYASMHWQKHHNPAALRTNLEQWWVSTIAADRRARSVAPDTAQPRAAAKAAQKYLTESKLHRFVEDSNFEFGVAPVTPAVITEVHRMQSAVAEPAACLLRRSASHKSMKQTLRRWRQKYTVGIGVASPLVRQSPLALTQQKVATSTPESKRVGQKRQAGVVENEPAVCGRAQNGGHIVTPKMGPLVGSLL